MTKYRTRALPNGAGYRVEMKVYGMWWSILDPHFERYCFVNSAIAAMAIRERRDLDLELGWLAPIRNAAEISVVPINIIVMSCLITILGWFIWA